jgi:hypothetical protein
VRFFAAMALFLGLVLAGASALPQQRVPNPAGEADISGTWNGVLGAGNASLHLVLTITKGSTGEYSGQLNSVDQGAVLPMEAIRVEGRQVRFEVKRVGGVYEGQLDEARSKITGTWTQTGVPPQPLSFEREVKSDKSKPAAPTGPKKKPITVAMDVSVPMPPTAFQGDGKTHLVYELRIINMSAWASVLKQIEVLTEQTPRSLATFSGASLEDSIARPGGITSDKSNIGSGMEATVFVWVTLARPEEVPGRIRHRVTVKLGDYP